MPEEKQTVVVGDNAVTTDAAGVAAIEGLKASMADMSKKQKEQMEKDEAEKKKLGDALDEANGSIKALEAKVADESKINDAVDAKLALADKARAVLGDDYDWRSKDTKAIDADVLEGMKAALVKKLGDAAVADMADGEIRGAYRVTFADAQKTDPIAGTVQDGVKPNDAAPTNSTAAYEASVKRTADAWKSKGGTA